MAEALARRPARERLVGFDARAAHGRGKPFLTLQVATATHCVVLHLFNTEKGALPRPVRALLEDASIIKCGVGIHEKAAQLTRDKGIAMTSLFDVERHAVYLRGVPAGGKTHLAALLDAVCGLAMAKKAGVLGSDWAHRRLSKAQLECVADDAVAAHLVGSGLLATVVPAPGGDVSGWLKAHDRRAAEALGIASRLRELRAQRKRSDEPPRRAADPPNGAAAAAGSDACVEVEGMNGELLFRCGAAFANFLRGSPAVAEVTEYSSSSSSSGGSGKGAKAMPQQLRLNFDPARKMRLCVHDAVGECSLGKATCPFAHGQASLHVGAAVGAATCAFCLAATHKLTTHHVVPKQFRRFLPPPFHDPLAVAGDTVLKCQLCSSFLSERYNREKGRLFAEAEAADATVRLTVVQICRGYAALLLDATAAPHITAECREEMTGYIAANYGPARRAAVSDELLQSLCAAPEEEVRHRVVMDAVVGADAERAAAFVNRWRRFCVDGCGLQATVHGCGGSTP